MNSREKGFSLVELVVAVTILGVALAIAVPMFAEEIAASRVRSVAFDLYGTFARARSEAISRNTTINVTMAGGGATGWSDGWSLVVDGTATTIDRKNGFTEAVQVSGPTSVVSFDYTGRANGSHNFDIVSKRYASRTRCVTLDLSGRPYIKSSGC